MQWYVQHTKAGTRFRIAEFDRATQRAQLVGDTGVPFERTLDDASLLKYGYVLISEPDPPPPPGVPS